MKTTKLYAKKTLSLFMAVMMLLTCWVWVAPEHEHASAATAGDYTVYFGYNVTNAPDKSDCQLAFVVFYKTANGTGTIGRVEKIISKGSSYFDNEERETYPVTVSGFPIAFEMVLKDDGGIGKTRLTWDIVKIGTSEDIFTDQYSYDNSWGSWGDVKGFTKSDAGSVTDGMSAYRPSGGNHTTMNYNWPVPSSIKTNPTAKTFNIPAGGTASNEFTAVFNDQYGVEWGADNIDPAKCYVTNGDGKTVGGLTFASVSGKNDTIKVTATEEVFNDLTDYDYNTGKGTGTLNMVWGNGSGSCTVTFQASSKHTVKYYDHNDAGVDSKQFYYGTPFSVVMSNLAAIKDTPLLKDDGTNDTEKHQTYVWKGYDSNDKLVNMTDKLKDSNTKVKQVADATEDHNFPDSYTANGDVNHIKTCQDCGYVASQPHQWIKGDDGKDLYTYEEIVSDNKSNDKYHSRIRTCSVCGHKEYVDHEHDITPTPIEDKMNKAATCTETGMQVYMHTCSLCSYERREERQLTTLPHTFSNKKGKKIIKEPTCGDPEGEPGLYVYWCEYCEDYEDDSAAKEIKALQHDWVAGETVAATCTTDGYTPYTCKNNSAHTKKDDIVPAFDHDWELTADVAAGCITDAYKEYVCKNDSSHTKKDVEKDSNLKGHLVATREEIIKQATCQEAGSKYVITYCSRCNEVISRKTVEIPQTTDHNYVAYPSAVDGMHEYKCGCGKKDESRPDEYCSGGTATCQNKAKCSECGREYGTTADHSYTEVVAQKYFAAAATCTKPAQYYKSCVWCGESTETSTKETFDYGVALPHTYDQENPVAENVATEATCKTQATYYYTCTCGAKGEETFAYGEFADHSYTREDHKSTYRAAEATCKTPALYYKSCIWCGASSQGVEGKEATFTYGETVDHVFDNNTRVTGEFLHKAATCTSLGEYYYTCRWCEEMNKAQTFRAGNFAEHDYIFVQKEIYKVTSATCTDGGEYYFSCSVCGAKGTETQAGAPLGHIKLVSRTNIVTANCNTPGAYYEITKCGREGYTWSDVSVTKDVISDTETKYTFVYKDENDADKTLVADVVNGAITFTDGEGNAVEEQNIITFTSKAGKHNYGGWIQTVAPSCVPGEEARTCSICGKFETREISANGVHKEFEKEVDEDGNPTDKIYRIEPTCTKAGQEYKICVACLQPVGSPLSALGHKHIDPEVKVDDDNNEYVDFHYDRLKTPATCVSEAVYYEHCYRCGKTMGGESATYEYGDKDTVNGHNFSTEAEWDDTDKKYYYYCQNEGCTARNEKPCEFVEIPVGATNEEIIALGAVVVTAPTCTAEGTAVIYCKSCGDKHQQTVTLAIDPANHTNEPTVVIPGEEAYCDKEGRTDAIYYACCYSEEEGADNTTALYQASEVIPADPTKHNPTQYQTIIAKEPSCIKDGYEAYTICCYCTEQNDWKEVCVTEKVIIPSTGHTYSDTWVQKTVTNDGVVTYTHEKSCSICADGTKGKVISEPCSPGEANCVDKPVCSVCNGVCGDVDENNHKTVVTVPQKLSTCTEEGYEAYQVCKECGEVGEDGEKADVLIGTITPIAKLPHDFEGATWTQIEEEGVKYHTRKCVVCNASTNDEAATEKEACVSDGTANCLAAASCSVCGGVYGDVDANVHASEEIKTVGAIEASCTAEGYTGDTYHACCYKEGDNEESASFISKGQAIEKEDHSYTVYVETVESTCVTKGKDVYKCENCDATDDRELPLNSRNHASKEVEIVGKKDATCTTAGYTGDYYHKCCYDSTKTAAENRKALISLGEEIPTNGTHKYTTPVPLYTLELDKNGAPVLEDVLNEDNEVIGKQFKLVTGEITYAMKVASRQADGYWYHAKKCSDCDEVVVARCSTLNPAYNCVDTDTCDTCKGLCSLIDEENHKEGLKFVSGTAATCIADGTKGYYECKHCKETYLDKAGNTKVDPESEEGKAALKIDKSTVSHRIDWSAPYKVVTGDCGTSGYKLFKCKVEGCTYEAKLDTGVVNTIHTWPTDPEENYVYTTTSAPTCGMNGYEAIRCTVCQAIKLNSYRIIPATGEHTYGDPVKVPGVDCTQPGTVTKTCTTCGHKDIQTDTSGTSAHKWSEDGSDGWVVLGGDCSTGVVYQRTCLVCGTVEQETRNSGEHQYKEYERVDPTAEKDGYVIYECENCGFKTDPEVLPYEGEEIEDPEGIKHKINHEQYKVVEDATCTSAEIREYVCLECGEKVRLPYGEMADHVWLKQPAEMALCEKDGHNEYYRCVRCLAEDGKEVIKATGHSDSNGDGKCDKCSAVFYEGGDKTCSCMCHKTGFMGFIYKIAQFFWKLFGTNKSCACGNVHY